MLLVYLLLSRGACNYQNAIACAECLLPDLRKNTLEKSGIHCKMNIRDKHTDLMPKTFILKTKPLSIMKESQSKSRLLCTSVSGPGLREQCQGRGVNGAAAAERTAA